MMGALSPGSSSVSAVLSGMAVAAAAATAGAASRRHAQSAQRARAPSVSRTARPFEPRAWLARQARARRRQPERVAPLTARPLPRVLARRGCAERIDAARQLRFSFEVFFQKGLI